MAGQAAESTVWSQHLLLGVAEELKLPLLQLARQSELGRLQGTADFKAMQATADTALKLLDGYLLGLQLSQQPHSLELESVSVSSILYDTAQQLDALAKSYGVSLELNIAGRFAPVLAHRQGLQSALTSLGAALIEALPALEQPQLRLQLATHRSRYGIVAGIYTDAQQVSSTALSQGRRLLGKGRQPLVTVSHTSGAGVFVADAILQAMQLHLRTSRHHRWYGLGTVLQPSSQIALV